MYLYALSDLRLRGLLERRVPDFARPNVKEEW